MPATLTAPGLYLQGAETPLPPLGSAITGFVGVPERGPINSPQPLSGWSDYVETFGGFVPFGYLAESVFGFFRNGGEKCWVVRAADTSRIGVVTPSGQCTRNAPLATAASSFADHTGTPTMRISALDPGGWGNRVSIRISTSALRPLRIGVLTQATATPDIQLTLDSIVDLRPGATLRITDPDGVSNGIDRTIAPGAASLNVALKRVDLTAAVGRIFPIGSVVYTAGCRIEAELDGRRESFDPLSFRTDHARYFASVINAPPTMVDYAERRRARYSSLMRVERLPGADFRPADTVLPQLLQNGDDGFTQASGTFPGGPTNALTIVAKRERGAAGNGLQVVALPFVAPLAAPAAAAQNLLVVSEVGGFQSGDVLTIGAGASQETGTIDVVLPGTMTLRLLAALTNAHGVGTAIAIADRFSLEARRPGAREPLEVIRNLSGNVAAGARFVRTAVQAESSWLCANMPAPTFTTPVPPLASFATITLVGGVDPGTIDARYYTGHQNDGAPFNPPELAPVTPVGLATLESVEEISLVAIPDLTRVAASTLVAAQTNMLRHCARLGDRFALIDAPEVMPAPVIVEGPPITVPTTEDWAAALGDATLRTYGAAYHPWVRGSYTDHDSLTPPSGLVAGLIARTDAQRGVNKAPANERLKGVFGLQPPVDRRRHGELNPLGINCVVKLEDGEIRLMGSRTLSSDAASRYVSIRRTILSVKKTLAQRMLWAVFEPMSAALFQRLEATLTTYLQALLARGVTASQRPGDAFYVRCNAETNPLEQQQLGIVVAEVGIALIAPAEFIVLTARRTPDAVQVIEEDA